MAAAGAGVLMKDFRMLNPLSENGKFSNTFLAERLNTGEHYVLKQLHPRHTASAVEIRRFVREGMFQVKFNHSITCTELMTAGNEAWQVRPFFEGTDLKNLPPVSTEEKLKIFKKILEAVDEIHSAGILHLDLKPSNIIIAPDLSGVKIIDFANAYPLMREQQGQGFNRSFWKLPGRTYPFTFYYSAPEQMLNFPDLFGKSTDYYSLGVMLYEWLSGRKPWDEAHPALLTNLMLVGEIDTHLIDDPRAEDFIRNTTVKFKFPKPPNTLTRGQQKWGLRRGMAMRKSPRFQ